MDAVLLNFPPTEYGVLMRYIGPYKIAHWLRKNGYTCQVIDFICHLNKDQIMSALEKFVNKETIVLGISTTFMSVNKKKLENETIDQIPDHLYDSIRYIKEKYPKLKIVLGGYNSENTKLSKLFDSIIMSYTDSNEDIFLEYIEHFKKDTPLPLGFLKTETDLSNDDLKNKIIIYNKPRNTKYKIENDDFKFKEQDIILYGEPLPLDVSRGCIFACSFCKYPHLGKGKLDYIRGMSYIEEELTYNYEKFGTTMYWILDDTFNDTEWKVSEFNKMAQRLSFKIKYVSYLRADLIHRFQDTAYMLKESGLFGAFHGLESLHPVASKTVGKAWSGKHAKDFIPELYHNVWGQKIHMHLSFIVGLPEETKKDIISTALWFKDNSLYSLLFYPLDLVPPSYNINFNSTNSKFEKNANQYGYSFDPDTKIWRHKYFNKISAASFSQTLNYNLNNVSKLIGWWELPLLYYGYKEEFIANTPRIYFLTNKSVEIKTQEKIQEYYQKLMSY